jgi:hypothetical protein
MSKGHYSILLNSFDKLSGTGGGAGSERRRLATGHPDARGGEDPKAERDRPQK